MTSHGREERDAVQINYQDRRQCVFGCRPALKSPLESIPIINFQSPLARPSIERVPRLPTIKTNAVSEFPHAQ